MNHIALRIILQLLSSVPALEAQDPMVVRVIPFAKGLPVSGREIYCHPRTGMSAGPLCPDPPRRLPSALPAPGEMRIGLLMEKLQVKSPAELAVEWIRPAGSPELTNVVFAIFDGNRKLLAKQACQCKNELSKVKSGEAIEVTLTGSSVSALAPHFKADNTLVVYTGFSAKALPKSSLTVVRAESKR